MFYSLNGSIRRLAPGEHLKTLKDTLRDFHSLNAVIADFQSQLRLKPASALYGELPFFTAKSVTLALDRWGFR